MRARKTITGVLAAALLAVASTMPASGAPITRHGCGASPQEVRTLRVITEWPKKVYKRGEIAKVKVTVTRPGPKDPAGLGMDMPDAHREPVEGASVSTALVNVFPTVAGLAETDADGVALVKFEIADHLKGKQDAFTDARVYHKTLPGGSDCTDILERGFVFEPEIFTVKG